MTSSDSDDAFGCQVFDRTSPIEDLKVYRLFHENGQKFLTWKTKEGDRIENHRREATQADELLKPNQLVPGASKPRLYQRIRDAVMERLVDAQGYRLQYDHLVTDVRIDVGRGKNLIDDGIKMMIALEMVVVVRTSKRLYLELSTALKSEYDRRRFLTTVADDLLSKSRRIKLLVSHGPTVGNYREQLLRSLLDNIVPNHYEVGTGFVEGCPRQIDILIWDRTHYSPLFREQSLVVVPLAAVRCVIEVKTVLSSQKLVQAMDLLHDIATVGMPVIPIFKGIFGFETTLDNARTVSAMCGHYVGVSPKNHPYRHQYFWQGVSAVCVPNKLLVRERYRPVDVHSEKFPQPMLTTVSSAWPGDTQTALFLALLLSHLDLPKAAKLQNAALMRPAVIAMEDESSTPIYDNWGPMFSKLHMELTRVDQPEPARSYCRNVHAFREGKMDAAQVSAGLSIYPTSTGLIDTTT